MIDISSSPFRPGNNTVAILSLYLGRKPPPHGDTWHNNEHADSGAHGILLSLRVCGRQVQTGTTATLVRAVVHPAYSNDIGAGRGGVFADPHQNPRASEPDIVFDARVANHGFVNWTQTDYDDATWPPAVTVAPAGGGVFGPLVPRPIPQWRRR